MTNVSLVPNNDSSIVMSVSSEGATVPEDSLPPIVHDTSALGSSADEACVEESLAARIESELALWTSPLMRNVHRIVARAALVDASVLITGERGTGKDVVARALHYLGHRCQEPFIKVSCAAEPGRHVEGDLFGREMDHGGTVCQPTVGKLEAAHRGTLLLDDIEQLPPSLQAKLLNVLEEGQYSRAGARSTSKVDVRLVVATARNLEAYVTRGQFREDLYYRLNVITIVVPPLRDRIEEITPLANYFAALYARIHRRTVVTLPAETMQRLQQHSFPGNVRELENFIKALVGLPGDGDLIRPASILNDARAALAADRNAIVAALEQTRWNRRRAAQLLNINYRSLLNKIKQAGLDRRRIASGS